MISKRTKTIGFGLIFLTAIICLPLAWAREGDYIQYDFSKPEEVFKTTINETVVGPGVDPAVLYQVLRSGQTLIINDHPDNPDLKWLTTAGVLINAPAEQLFAVLQDYDSYNQFMNQVGRAWSEPVADKIDRVHYELVVEILFLKIKMPYSVYHYYQPPYRVDWVMSGGKFNCNYGAYEVVPVPGDPGRCMLFYTSYALARNSIIESLYDRIPSMDMMINMSTGTIWTMALKNRAEELFRKKGGKLKPSAGKVDLVKLMNEHPETLAKLVSRGRLVVLENNKPTYYTGGAIVNKSRDEAFKSVSDLVGMSSISEHYSVSILDKGDNTARAKFETVISLVVDFESEYVVNYTFESPRRMTFVGEPDNDLEDVAGSWEFIELGKDYTLVFYRNTQNIKSQGMLMRQLLKIEPTFGNAIMASMTQYVVEDMKIWVEASPKERQRLAAEAAKKK